MNNQPGERKNGQGITLATVLIATFMGIIDTSIINVAAPSIQKGLGTGFQQIQLIIAGYIIAYGVALVTGGRLGDTYGRKRLFQMGVFAFVVTSLACAISPTASLLIIARVLQGLSGALMLPQVLSTIQVVFDGPARARALGFYGATIGFASIIAQLVGGLLISWNLFDLSWRLVFLVNIPIGLIALALSQKYVPESKSERPQQLDLGGSMLLGISIATLLYPLILGVRSGWSLFFSFLILVSIVSAYAFIRWERRMEWLLREPLLRLELFSFASYRIGMLTVLTFYGANAGFYLILSYFYQAGQHLSPLASGWGYAPLGVGFMLGSLLAKRLAERYGIKVLLSGIAIKMLGLILLAGTVHYLQTALALSPSLFVAGVGEGLVAVLLIGKILAGIHSDAAGLASGSLLTATQLANVLSVALTGGLFTYLITTSHFSYTGAFTRTLIWLFILVVVTAMLLYRLGVSEKSAEVDLPIPDK